MKGNATGCCGGVAGAGITRGSVNSLFERLAILVPADSFLNSSVWSPHYRSRRSVIKGLPEQIKNPNVNAGGGTWGFGLWVNSLALHSWLKQSKTNKRQLLKEKLFS